MAVVLMASFMELLDSTIVNVAAPDIVKDLGASQAALQWIVAGFTLALGTAMITGGRVGDQFGRRRAFLTGLTGFALASLLCAVAPNPGVLVAARVLQGLTGGLMVPQVFGIIRSSLPPAVQAKAYAAYGAVLGMAGAAGPLLGGFLVDANLFGLGWRAIFWVNIPIAVLALALGAKFLPESSADHKTRFDLTGAALAAITAVLLLLPLVQGHQWGWPWWGFALMGAAAVTGTLFLTWERRLNARGSQPIFDPALLKARAFSGGLAVSFLFYGGVGSFFFLLSLYLQLGAGMSAWKTGLVILPYAIGAMIISGVGMQFAHRAGRALIISGSLLVAASQVILLLVVHHNADPGYWLLAVPLLLGGLGIGLTSPSLIKVILAGVPGKDAGSAGGVLTTANQIGNSAGVAILGVVFFNTLSNSLSTGSTPLHGYSHAFLTALPWLTGCYVLAAALMLLLPKHTTEPAHDQPPAPEPTQAHT